MLEASGLTGFEWDGANEAKNRIKHGVSVGECEEVFFNAPLVVVDDVKHSHTEQRYFVLGQTNSQRNLFIVFTIRGDKIRVISARNMNRKERIVYE